MEVYLGLIFPSALNFVPQGLMTCGGQQLQISQYNALYSLLGTVYGGDARTTFNLPDLRGRTIVGYGAGPGLTPRPQMGYKSGAEAVQLSLVNMPVHNHEAVFTPVVGPSGGPVQVTLRASTQQATEATPGTNNACTLASPYYEDGTAGIYGYVADNAPTVALAGITATGGGGGITGGTVTVGNNGGSQAFSIMPPFMVLNYLIVVEGLYPPRN